MKPTDSFCFAQPVTLKAEVLQAAAEDGDWERRTSCMSPHEPFIFLFFLSFLQNDSQLTGLIKSDLFWIFLDLLGSS